MSYDSAPGHYGIIGTFHFFNIYTVKIGSWNQGMDKY